MQVGRAIVGTGEPSEPSATMYQRVGNYLLAALLIAQAPHDVIGAVTEVLSGERDQIVAAPADPSDTDEGGSGEPPVVWPPEAG